MPLLIGTIYFSEEGFHSGYFLGAIDLDVKPVSPSSHLYAWPVSIPPSPFQPFLGARSDKSEQATSSSFQSMTRLTNSPVHTSLGPLSRLISHTLLDTKPPDLILTALSDIHSFTRTLATQYRATKLSTISTTPAPNSPHFDATTTANTLLHLHKSLFTPVLFSTSLLLHSIHSRLLVSNNLSSDNSAPEIASLTLHILRDLYFITLGLVGDGAAAEPPFAQYAFVYYTSLDVLSAYPPEVAEEFVRSIAPPVERIGNVAEHPFDRILDLYFLNVLEHLAGRLPTETSKGLLVPAAAPYLALDDSAHNPGDGRRGLEGTYHALFESAHVVMLSVFSAPQNAPLAMVSMPTYVDSLFRAFPANVSPRQMSLAFRTLVGAASPSSRLSTLDPGLALVLLEVLRYEAVNAPSVVPPLAASSGGESQAQSPRATLVLTLISTLPMLPVAMLGEWLVGMPEVIKAVEDGRERRRCGDALWEAISSGAMDVERASVSVGWWYNGGRDAILRIVDERNDEQAMMSDSSVGRLRTFQT